MYTVGHKTHQNLYHIYYNTCLIWCVFMPHSVLTFCLLYRFSLSTGKDVLTADDIAHCTEYGSSKRVITVAVPTASNNSFLAAAHNGGNMTALSD